jgi:hypothetical protein
MTETKEIDINSIHQLIDLNKDLTNFKLQFNIQTKNSNEKCHAAVVSQSQLDSNNDIEYKIVENGKLSGEIVADKDIYQNYYLCLKTIDNNPLKVRVTTHLEKIDGVSAPPNNIVENYNIIENKDDGHWYSFLYSKTFLVIVGLILVAFVYFYFFYTPSIPKMRSVGPVPQAQPPPQVPQAQPPPQVPQAQPPPQVPQVPQVQPLPQVSQVPQVQPSVPQFQAPPQAPPSVQQPSTNMKTSSLLEQINKLNV